MSETRVCLVTGVGGPAGKAIALALAADGWTLAAADPDAAAAAAVAAAACRAGGRAEALALDPATVPAAELVAAAGRLGALRCVVPALRGAVADDFGGLDAAAAWSVNQRLHLLLPAELVDAFQAALPAGAQGAAVFLADGRVEPRSRGFLSYCLAMRGLEALVRAAAAALAPRLRVNAVGPSQAAGRQALPGDALAPTDALAGRLAGVVRFILAAPAMTGQCILLHENGDGR